MGSLRDGRRILGEGRFTRLVEDNGWEYVERRRVAAVVAMVAVTPAGEVLLVEQERRSVGGPVIELPAGLVGDGDDAAESIETAAGRELLEETGWRAGRITVGLTGPSSTGLTNEMITFVFCDDLSRVHDGGGVDDERISVHAVALAEVDRWLLERNAEGRYVDPRIFAGLRLREAIQP